VYEDSKLYLVLKDDFSNQTPARIEKLNFDMPNPPLAMGDQKV